MNELAGELTRELPEGTVTFLFTDIEGSTKLLRQLGDEYAKVLADQRRILRAVFAIWHGSEVDTQGDSFFISFPKATEAAAAAVEIQRSLTEHKWPQDVQVRVRMGLHTGEPLAAEEGYVGMDVHRAARIAHVGHGGQVLLSATTTELVIDELPDGASLLDHGHHGLKDIARPEHIRQLVIRGLRSDYPPLKSLEAIDADMPVIPNNLPVQSTPFIGREEELAALEGMLIDPDIRLITIVGPGGIGKTRLALAFAERQLCNFKHGVFFTSLASLDMAEDIVPAVARGLGFNFYEGVDHRTQLIDYLRAKSMLILLDNFEHLLEGASLAAEVVQAAPGVRVIVTSREPLRLLDEQLFSVHGLDFPEWETPEDALEYDAARLFLSSARRSRSEFDLGQEDLQPMTRICRLVQGMPLGIVLAAGWVELLSPAEIAEELGQGIDILESDLHDIPERQRSMQAVFDYTWEQLNQREREVLQRLSVFRGGCGQQAIRQVTGATLMELKSLTGKSLINTNRDGRHEMHELLRQYTTEKLERNPEADFEAHDRHCSYYLDSIAEREDDLFGPQVKRVMADIDGDLENVRSALRWAAAHQQVDYLDRAINPLFQYYYWRTRHNSMFRDAQIIIEGLDRVDSPEARLITARALARQGWFLPDQEDLELVMKSEAILHRNDLFSLDTRKDKAFILWRLGGLTIASDPQRGLEMSKESLVLFREVGDLWGEAAALNNLARHANVTGNLEEEKRLREKCKIIYEQMGNPIELAESLIQLAWLAADQLDVEEPEHLARQSHKMLDDVGYPSSVARSSFNLGLILFRIGRFDEALERLKEARVIFEDLGHVLMKMRCIFWIAWTYLHIGEYESAGSLAGQCLSYYESTVTVGGVYLLLANLALVRKDPADVRRHAQKAMEIFRAIHLWMGEHSCLGLISHAERLSGNESASRHHLIEAFRISTRRKELALSDAGLAPAALLLADRGEVERAVETYEVACQRPFVANSQWFEDVFGKHIAAMAQSLTPEVVAAARQRGRERDLWETAKEILAELEAENEQE